MVYDVMVMGNGVLAGLVAITAPCAVVWPWAAIIIGLVAGVIYTCASMVSIIVRVRSQRTFTPCSDPAFLDTLPHLLPRSRPAAPLSLPAGCSAAFCRLHCWMLWMRRRQRSCRVLF